ncbi:hypothetical protein P3S68_020146 [Capsicum galapagoense]
MTHVAIIMDSITEVVEISALKPSDCMSIIKVLVIGSVDEEFFLLKFFFCLTNVVYLPTLFIFSTITLWGEASNIENELLQKLSVENLIVAFCNVKTTLYEGNFGLGSTSITTMWINPTFEKATSLHEWSLLQKKTQPNITLLPTLHIKTAKTLTIGDIASDLFDNELKCCKLNATIKKIINSNDPYYASCTKCYKKVDHGNSKCPRCLTEKSDYENRFLLKMDVFTEAVNCTAADCTESENAAHYTEADRCTVTLFEAARYLIGCNVKSYVQSILEKSEESPFYHSLVLSKSKEYTFLIRLDGKMSEIELHDASLKKKYKKLKSLLQLKILLYHKDKAHEDATEDPIATKRVKLEKDS